MSRRRDEDVHDPALWRGAIMCSDGERAAFNSFCDAGLVDTLRLASQETGLFTWWDYRMLSFPKNRGLRIDAVLASQRWRRGARRRHRSRDAQRQGAIRSRADLGGVSLLSEHATDERRASSRGDPPPKPLMLFDGDCHFCRRWIERWREMTAAQSITRRPGSWARSFPKFAPEECERAVQFIETDGTRVERRGGCFPLVRLQPRREVARARAYDRVPRFAPITEARLRVRRRNRQLASAGTRLLWGNDVRRPTYFIARQVFLRALGLIYLIAFISLWTQVDGLDRRAMASRRSRQFLPAAREQLGRERRTFLPTLMLAELQRHVPARPLRRRASRCRCCSWRGSVPGVALLLLFVCYLSLTIAGQTFLSFQWDILLLETGFLAIFFAPWRWRISAAASAGLACRVVPAEAAALQTDVHVGRGEADERR